MIVIFKSLKWSVNGVMLQAEEITLTIGQAFDLAYKKFLESGGKDVETRKQIGGLQKRVGLAFIQLG